MNRRLFIKAVGTLPLWNLSESRAYGGGRFPQRIATPDRGATQTLLALGKKPVVSVSRDFYEGMGTTPPLPPGIPDAGDPSEPNLELLKLYDVDLIVTVTISSIIQAQLSRVAPVFALNIYQETGDTFRRACDETLRLAAALGEPSAAQRYIRKIENDIARAKKALANKQSQAFILAGLSTDGRHMTVYSKNSIMSAVMTRLGLVDGWRGGTNNYGFINAGIEVLASYSNANLMLIDYGPSTRTALRVLYNSPLWRALPVVRQNRIFTIPRFEIFGGLPIAEQFTAIFSHAVLNPAPAA